MTAIAFNRNTSNQTIIKKIIQKPAASLSKDPLIGLHAKTFTKNP